MISLHECTPSKTGKYGHCFAVDGHLHPQEGFLGKWPILFELAVVMSVVIGVMSKKAGMQHPPTSIDVILAKKYSIL